MILAAALALAATVVEPSGGDDTDALQAALASGSVELVEGTYNVRRRARWAALTVPSGAVVQGKGPRSVLRLMDGQGQGSDLHVLEVVGARGVRISDLTIDGNRAGLASPDEQTHAVNVVDSSDVVIERVRFVETHGDGVKVSGTDPARARGLTVDGCDFIGSNRGGITLHSATSDVRILRNRFEGISDQAIDFEPGENSPPPRSVLIADNVLDVPASPGVFVLTIAGASSTVPTSAVQVRSNTIRGPVLVVRARDVRLVDNTIDSPARCLDMNRSATDVLVLANSMVCGTTGAYLAAANGAPTGRVTFAANTVTARDAIVVESGAPGALIVTANRLRALVPGQGSGLYARALTELPGLTVADNVLDGFAVGVRLYANRGSILGASVSGRAFVDVAVPVRCERVSPYVVDVKAGADAPAFAGVCGVQQ